MILHKPLPPSWRTRRPATTDALQRLQRLRRLGLLWAFVALAGLVVASRSLWFDLQPVRDGLGLAGLLLVVVAVAGRCWATLYIAGSKKISLVTEGPYSLCRNPLYVCSVLGSLGIGLASGMIVIGILAATVTCVALHFIVQKEEESLRARYGTTYDAYATSVPRWVPTFSDWRPAEVIQVRVALLHRAAIESILVFGGGFSLYFILSQLSAWIGYQAFFVLP